MIDFIFLEQELNAFTHPFSNTAAAFDHCLKVGLDIAAHRNAVIGGMEKVSVNLCALKQGLGRDTSPVQADSAKFSAFNNGNFHTQL